jgi:hypothetical protein
MVEDGPVLDRFCRLLRGTQAKKTHLTEKDTPAHLGAELVDKIVHTVGDGGLSWIYFTLNDDPNHIPLSERPAMVCFATAESPVYTYIVQKCLEEKNRQQPEPAARRMSCKLKRYYMIFCVSPLCWFDNPPVRE